MNLRRRTVLAALALAPMTVASCKPRDAGGKPKVAVSIFPLYDLVKRVGGDAIDAILVLPPGRSEHDYDPTPKEMAQVAQAKLAICIGLGVDAWLERIVKSAAGDKTPILQVGPGLDPRKIDKDMVGDEAADAARPADDHHDEHAHERGADDPHVWLDPVRMQRAIAAIVTSLAQLVPAAAEGFRARGDATVEALGDLHAFIGGESKKWNKKTIVTFHGSMAYFAARYGLTIAAVIEPFPGKEPTAKYLSEVLDSIRKTNAAALFSEPQLDPRPAKVVADQAKVPLFELDPVGGDPSAESYEALLKKNVAVLDKALA